MGIIDSKVYNRANTVIDFILLNFLWLLFCIPIVTIFPATTAMYGVVRKWDMEKEPALLKTYLIMFKENFFQSLIIGILSLIFTFFLYMDFYLRQGNSILFIILAFAVCLHGLTLLYIFPIVVNYNNSLLKHARSALYLMVFNPMHTVVLIAISISSLIILYLFPFSILFIGSVTAYFQYQVVNKTFKKIAQTNRHYSM